jgi:aminoglycoside phosphotransferase (APT) family kinase protein
VRVEPPIDHELLVDAVRKEYGLMAESLTFVPVGFVAACYVVRCRDWEPLFLKLWPDTRVGRLSAARRDVSLRLTRALYEREIYPRVPYPIATASGALSSHAGGRPFAVYPFLPGRVAPEWATLTTAQRDEFARVLATVHRATPQLADVLPPRETFDVPFEGELRNGLDAVQRVGPGDRAGLRALKDFLGPRGDEVEGQLDRLLRLRDVVRRVAGPFVLCHTDMGGDNLLIDDMGHFFVLDWDDATLAPPEHDLWSGVGPGFGHFVEVYARHGGSLPLRLDHFAFCILRRALADLTARLTQLLEGETSDEEDAELVEGMERWGFARWRGLDEGLLDIARQI